MPDCGPEGGTMAGMHVSARPARPDDAEVLGRVHVRAWRAAYRGVMPDDYLDGLDESERAAMWARFFELAPADRRLTVVTVDEEVVGFACFARCRDAADDDVAELFAINRDPEHWGRGLGRELLSRVTDELVAFGYHCRPVGCAGERSSSRAVRVGGVG